MRLIANNIKWIMLVSGVLTCTVVYGAIDPQAFLTMNFGESLDGPLAEVIVRNWAILITLVGLALIHGALRPAARTLALMIAVASKAAFVALVLSAGRYLDNQVVVALGADALLVVIFALYLLSPRAVSARG